MTKKETFLIVFGIVWLVFLIFFINHWLKTPNSPNPTEQVLVASTDIKANQALQEKDVHWEKISSSEIDAQDIKKGEQKLNKYLGRKLTVAVAAKEKIKTSYFAKTQIDRLSQLIGSKKYAMTILLNKNNADNLFITPGDRVDVFLTRALAANSDRNTQGSQFITQILLANVRVLAVNNSMNSLGVEHTTNNDSPVMPKLTESGAKTLTLELSLKEAERLSLAVAAGSLSFTLHSDSGVFSDKSIMPFTSQSLDPPPRPIILEYHGDKVILNQNN